MVSSILTSRQLYGQTSLQQLNVQVARMQESIQQAISMAARTPRRTLTTPVYVRGRTIIDGRFNVGNDYIPVRMYQGSYLGGASRLVDETTTDYYGSFTLQGDVDTVSSYYWVEAHPEEAWTGSSYRYPYAMPAWSSIRIPTWADNNLRLAGVCPNGRVNRGNAQITYTDWLQATILQPDFTGNGSWNPEVEGVILARNLGKSKGSLRWSTEDLWVGFQKRGILVRCRFDFSTNHGQHYDFPFGLEVPTFHWAWEKFTFEFMPQHMFTGTSGSKILYLVAETVLLGSFDIYIPVPGMVPFTTEVLGVTNVHTLINPAQVDMLDIAVDPSHVVSPKAGDLNMNGRVDVSDLAVAAANYGAPIDSPIRQTCDLNKDSVLNILDLVALCINYSQANVLIPESVVTFTSMRLPALNPGG